MDKHHIQGGVKILLVKSLHASKTGISSCLTDHLARTPIYLYQVVTNLNQ